MKILGILLGVLLGIELLLGIPYAAECTGSLCCEGEDSGYSYWTGSCADTEKDPSLAGKFCSSGTWVDYATNCGCPSGYEVDTSDNEDGVCVEAGTADTDNTDDDTDDTTDDTDDTTDTDDIIDDGTDETDDTDTTDTGDGTTTDTIDATDTADTTTQAEPSEYYKYTPVNAEEKESSGCTLSTILITLLMAGIIYYKY